MLSCIKSIDQIGKSFTFNIEGSVTFRTPVGGVFSILIGMGIILLTWYFGKDIYRNEKPNFLMNEDFLVKFPFVNKTNEKRFRFAFRMELIDGTTVDNPKYFEYGVTLKEYKITRKGEITLQKNRQIQSGKCNTSHYDNQTLYNEHLYNYYCPENHSYVFGGSWNDEVIIIPEGYVKRCDDETEEKYKIKCADKDDPFFKENYFFFSYILTKNLVNPKNKDNPIKESYHYYYSGLNINEVKTLRYRVHYAISKMLTDEGWIFIHYQNKDFIEFENLYTEFTSQYKKKHFVAVIQFFTSRIHRHYLRSYIKIPDLIAIIGGFLVLFMNLFHLIFDIYLNNEFYSFFYRKLFNFQIEEEESLSNSNKEEFKAVKSLAQPEMELKDKDFDVHSLDKRERESRLELKSPKSILFRSKTVAPPFLKNLENSKENNSQELNKEIRKLIEFKKKHRRIVKLSSAERFYFNFCCYGSTAQNVTNEKSLKYELMLAAESSIAKKTEILEMLKTLDQFRLLKKIILNENQCFMMDQRDLQMIVNKNARSNDEIEKLLEDIKQEKRSNLIHYLKSLKQESKVTSIDTLLFGYLNRDFKKEIGFGKNDDFI